MIARRRWFQFSLRTFLVAVTVGCVGLGWWVNRAQIQMEVVTKIDDIAVFHYELHPEIAGFNDNCINKLLEPAMWHSQHHFWHHLWHRVRAVAVGIEIRRTYTYDSPFGFIATHDADYIERTLPLLQRLPSLEVVYLQRGVSKDMEDKIRAALPDCEIVRHTAGVGFNAWDD